MNTYYWSYDKDAEIYTNSADTIEECIAEANKDKYMGADAIYIGELEEYVPYIFGSDLIDMVAEAAYNECGECAETWLENIEKEESKDLEEKLNEVFSKWMADHSRTVFFGKVINVKRYSLIEQER